MIVPLDTSARERELTAPVALTLPNGRLNPAAIGWARTPLVDTSGIAAARRTFPHQWGRNKRWEYWNVITPTHILALTISSIDYAAVHEAWVFERATERSWGRAATVVPARDVTLPPSLDGGQATARAKDLSVSVTPDGDGRGWHLHAQIADAGFDVTVTRPAHHVADRGRWPGCHVHALLRQDLRHQPRCRVRAHRPVLRRVEGDVRVDGCHGHPS